jgi:hypothetical protein
MNVAKPTPVQILLAWRDNRWVVLRNAAEVGAYAYRSHAMATARRLAAEAADAGLDCYMLVRDQNGRWEERPCPKSASKAPPP